MLINNYKINKNRFSNIGNELKKKQPKKVIIWQKKQQKNV